MLGAECAYRLGNNSEAVNYYNVSFLLAFVYKTIF